MRDPCVCPPLGEKKGQAVPPRSGLSLSSHTSGPENAWVGPDGLFDLPGNAPNRPSPLPVEEKQLSVPPISQRPPRFLIPSCPQAANLGGAPNPRSKQLETISFEPVRVWGLPGPFAGDSGTSLSAPAARMMSPPLQAVHDSFAYLRWAFPRLKLRASKCP